MLDKIEFHFLYTKKLDGCLQETGKGPQNKHEYEGILVLYSLSNIAHNKKGN